MTLRTLRAVAVAVCFAAAPLPGVAGEAPKSELKRLVPWKGGPTPALELKDLDGKVHRLADYRGQVVLINFWATWCEPCREEMPAMQKLKARLAGRPFAILAVNYGEGEGKIRTFLEKTPLDFHMLVDTSISVPRPWGVRILPTSVLVGPDGVARQQVVGEYDWAADDAVAAVEKLLAEAARKPAAVRN